MAFSTLLQVIEFSNSDIRMISEHTFMVVGFLLAIAVKVGLLQRLHWKPSPEAVAWCVANTLLAWVLVRVLLSSSYLPDGYLKAAFIGISLLADGFAISFWARESLPSWGLAVAINLGMLAWLELFDQKALRIVGSLIEALLNPI